MEPLLIDLSIAALVLLVFTADLLMPSEEKRGLGHLACAGLVLILATTFALDLRGDAFGGVFVLDPLALWFKRIFLGAWESNHAFWMVPAVLGAFFTAVYVLRATRQIFWGPSKAESFPHLSDARGTEWVALILLGSMIVLFGIWPALALHPIDQTTMNFLPRLTGLLPH